MDGRREPRRRWRRPLDVNSPTHLDATGRLRPPLASNPRLTSLVHLRGRLSDGAQQAKLTSVAWEGAGMRTGTNAMVATVSLSLLLATPCSRAWLERLQHARLAAGIPAPSLAGARG